MTSQIPRGLRVAAWTATGLIAMAGAAGTATAVGSHHHDGGSDGSHQMPEFVHSISTYRVHHHFVTIKRQAGTIEDVNSEAIVVTSPGEYAATYSLGKDTKVGGDCDKKKQLSEGDKVSVVAKKVNGHFRAEFIATDSGHHDWHGRGR